MARRGPIARLFAALFRWLAWTLAAFVVASVLLVVVLRFLPPPTSSFMLQARLDALVHRQPIELRQEWRDMDAIAPQAALAVVASEDQLFPVHRGFDFESMRRAMEHNDRGGRTRGASTITQQVAKNLFLWGGRSYVRKGLEAWFTVLLETLWSKRRILEVYLNVAEFGRGVYGVESAARAYFHKPARDLNGGEAALMAAVLPNPRRLRLDRPSAYVRSRGREIEAQMRALGADYLSKKP